MSELCARCGEHERTPMHPWCRLCRYRTRGRHETSYMRQITVRLPGDVLDALLAEAEDAGRSLSETLRARLKAGMP